VEAPVRSERLMPVEEAQCLPVRSMMARQEWLQWAIAHPFEAGGQTCLSELASAAPEHQAKALS
jgi:hypothetical protein